MLHVHFAKCDAQKWFRRLKNQSKLSSKGFKIHQKINSPAVVLQRTPSNLMFSKICYFLTIFGTPNRTKIDQKMLKSWFCKKHIFEDDFLSNFRRCGFRKCLQNQQFVQHFSKTSILQKSCSRLDGSSIFRVRSLQKNIKKRFEKAFQNNIKNTCPEIEFWQPFWAPKSSNMAPKSDAERSLFRDAMQPAQKSSQVNGSRRL